MAQDYDKIFKENIEQMALPLAEKLLAIRPEKLKDISVDLQQTIERKPDFIKKVVHKDATKDYILHIEFQVVDEPKMLHRMLEYYALMFRKHNLRLKQVVFYIGEGKAKMLTQINHNELNFEFSLVNVQEIAYTEFLNSDKPEEVILAILANFQNKKPEIVIQSILQRIINLTEPNLKQLKYVRQLEILSLLRDLDKETLNQTKNMALIFDIEKDHLFKKGEGKGIAIAAKRMLLANFTIQQVADVLKVPKEMVEEIAKSIKK
ncbi:MAG: hypothetical protein COZ18_06590 [Flexibacter sp. CG_4_10_14_3_um_filter_32_15]|nr:MAG: hypothetical protein COZ18_06590 [Flexibacter sp. CG_4_10_14_3_um_filter_32_15]